MRCRCASAGAARSTHFSRRCVALYCIVCSLLSVLILLLLSSHKARGAAQARHRAPRAQRKRAVARRERWQRALHLAPWAPPRCRAERPSSRSGNRRRRRARRISCRGLGGGGSGGRGAARGAARAARRTRRERRCRRDTRRCRALVSLVRGSHTLRRSPRTRAHSLRGARVLPRRAARRCAAPRRCDPRHASGAAAAVCDGRRAAVGARLARQSGARRPPPRWARRAAPVAHGECLFFYRYIFCKTESLT